MEYYCKQMKMQYSCHIIFVIVICSICFTHTAQEDPVVNTKYGELRGKYREVHGVGGVVATYLGVPYATPPIGVNRFSPTRTLSQWVGTYEATSFGPACPQQLPDITNETLALMTMSRSQLEMFRRAETVLKHQSEDCLYLNIYVPEPEYGKQTELYPVLVFVPGPSFEWGSASLYDGSVLAARGKIVVVTLNYRIGLLGFLNPNVDVTGRATVANYGLMDQLAALHWVQENIVLFGGDPGQVTVMGHGAGAACLNFLAISPAASGATLFKRAILMSGCALSPWAHVENPSIYALEAAIQLGCEVSKDVIKHSEALLHCLRERSVEQILKVKFKTPQFKASIGPSIDGVTVKSDWHHTIIKMGKEGRTSIDLLMGVTEKDISTIFNENDLEVGFETDQRERYLRTYVANNYRYHLQEILLSITAEYTDWTDSVEFPSTIRDLTAEALHDASLVSPISTTAARLSTPSRSFYFYVFNPTRDRDPREEERKPSINELPYIFGIPLGANSPLLGQKDYSKSEVILSEAIITFWTNFVKTGDPNDPGTFEKSRMQKMKYKTQQWTKYDPDFKKYLEIGANRGRTRDHYRASEVALWTWLVPNLERVGERFGPDSPFHRLPDENVPSSFSGPTRAWSSHQSMTPPASTDTYPLVESTVSHKTYQDDSLHMPSGELPAPLEVFPAREPEKPSFSYSTALSLTIAIGASLLLLNLLVFAAVYYKRDPNVSKPSTPDGSTDMDQGPSSIKRHCGSRCYKSSSPSHCGTLRSSLATSCEEDVLREYPPDYTACCISEQQIPMVQSNNGSTTLKNVAKPPPPPRSSSVPSHVEAQPLLSSVNLLQDKHTHNNATTEIRL